jgi:hypothetical protein
MFERSLLDNEIIELTEIEKEEALRKTILSALRIEERQHNRYRFYKRETVTVMTRDSEPDQPKKLCCVIL